MSTLGLDRGRKLLLGLRLTTHRGEAPAHAGGPLEAPFSRKWYCVVCVCVVCGMVYVGLRVLSLFLSLSVEEGRYTFGIMAEILAKF